MKDTSGRRIFRRAIALSVLLTAVMALCGTISSMVRPLSWLSYVSRVIAFPASLVVRQLVAAVGFNGHSIAGAIALELIGVALTLIFYALLAGAAFLLVSRRAIKEIDKRPGISR